MKRINIEYSTYYNFISELDIRPSVKKRIEHALHYNHFYDTRDLCKKKEEELYEIPDIDEKIVKEIKGKLLDAGLHFDMTDEQLDDYMDAEFLHPVRETASKAKGCIRNILIMALIVALPASALIYFVDKTFDRDEIEVPVKERSYNTDSSSPVYHDRPDVSFEDVERELGIGNDSSKVK